MKLVVVPYKQEHFGLMTLRDCHKFENVKAPSPDSRALTCMYGDQPIAIIGGVQFLPGVMVLWSLLTDDISRCPVSFHKACKHLIDFYLNNGYRRLVMTVRRDYEVGFRWAKALGFQCEGIMKKYAPDGMDCFMFARTT